VIKESVHRLDYRVSIGLLSGREQATPNKRFDLGVAQFENEAAKPRSRPSRRLRLRRIRWVARARAAWTFSAIGAADLFGIRTLPLIRFYNKRQ
jgi:hypothetical protein